MNLYFTDHFDVTRSELDEYGAFNISLLVDLPLFVDPFLLFNSDRQAYSGLHDSIIEYLRTLRRLSATGPMSTGRIRSLYCFPEVEQNWLGFSKTGNSGRGLGMKFAKSLSSNLNALFPDFGDEGVTKGSHLEKLCLIESGVGRDRISDFTTNLIKGFLCRYTEEFAAAHIDPKLVSNFAVERVRFSSKTETWLPQSYRLPRFEESYVLLTPKDILTKDDT
jgi:hypothetical protein